MYIMSRRNNTLATTTTTTTSVVVNKNIMLALMCMMMTVMNAGLFGEAFVMQTRTQQTPSFVVSRPTYQQLHALLAPELEEFSSSTSTNDVSEPYFSSSASSVFAASLDSSWIKKDGGYIPNIRPRPTSSSSSSSSVLQREIQRAAPGGGRAAPGISKTETSTNIRTVSTLDEYKRVVIDNEDDKSNKKTLTVVKFYADWCRACQGIERSYRQLADEYQQRRQNKHAKLNDMHVRFVQVPLTKETASLMAQGLNIPSLPYAHVYHTDAGLLEERRINKKHFRDFTRVLKQYENGSCDIEYDEDDDGAVVITEAM